MRLGVLAQLSVGHVVVQDATELGALLVLVDAAADDGRTSGRGRTRTRHVATGHWRCRCSGRVVTAAVAAEGRRRSGLRRLDARQHERTLARPVAQVVGARGRRQYGHLVYEIAERLGALTQLVANVLLLTVVLTQLARVDCAVACG